MRKICCFIYQTAGGLRSLLKKC
ncbi:MAG: (2Fe-2S)-binding protein [Chitinophagaceae bacterium]|nr:(2Fe-2S)-binding protein [Chitinophagaceae bacterium]